MAFSLFAPALAAGAFAVGIALAPAAAADDEDIDSVDSAQAADAPERGPNAVDVQERPGPDAATSDFNSDQIPQGWRNDALWGGNPAGSSPFGTSTVRPPVIALD